MQRHGRCRWLPRPLQGRWGLTSRSWVGVHTCGGALARAEFAARGATLRLRTQVGGASQCSFFCAARGDQERCTGSGHFSGVSRGGCRVPAPGSGPRRCRCSFPGRAAHKSQGEAPGAGAGAGAGGRCAKVGSSELQDCSVRLPTEGARVYRVGNAMNPAHALYARNPVHALYDTTPAHLCRYASCITSPSAGARRRRRAASPGDVTSARW